MIRSRLSIISMLCACVVSVGCSSNASPDAGSSVDSGERDDSATPIDAALPGPDASRVMDASSDRDAAQDSGPPDAGCQCDDGIDCTFDACNPDGSCAHEVRHIACPAGQYCSAAGCTDGPICATDADCPRPDPCLLVTCDPSRRLCAYNLIDGDGDGVPPTVCGGGDCDDSTTSISPSGVEVCDGVDQDCDDTVDEDVVLEDGTSRSSCEAGYLCVSAECACPGPRTECMGTYSWEPTHCADLQADETDCGACNARCPPSSTCMDATCVCDPGTTDCGGGCFDLTSDRNNCGACGHGCELECVASVCECPSGESLCDGPGARSHCSALDSDPTECGACGVVCMRDSECTTGVCEALTVDGVTYSSYAATGSHIAAGFARSASTNTAFLHVPTYSTTVTRTQGSTRTDVFTSAAGYSSMRQYVVAVGSDLSHLWATRASTGFPAALEVDTVGDVFLAGRYASGTYLDATSYTIPSGSAGGVVAKLDGATGAVLWARTLVGAPGTEVTDIVRLPSGELAAVGTMAASYDFGSGTALDTSGGSGFVWRFASDQTYAAAWRVPGRPLLVSSDETGNVIVVGSFSGSITLGTFTLTGYEYVARFSPTGTVLDAFALSPTVYAVTAIESEVALATPSDIRRCAWDGTTVWTLPLTNATTDVLLAEGGTIIAAGGARYGASPAVGGRMLTTGWNLAWVARITATGTLDRVGDFWVGSVATGDGYIDGMAALGASNYLVAGAYKKFVGAGGLSGGPDNDRGGYFVELSFPSAP